MSFEVPSKLPSKMPSKLPLNVASTGALRRPRLPVRMPAGVKAPGLQIGAGALSVIAGAVAAVSFVDNFSDVDTSGRIAFSISIAAAVVGGVLTIVRIAFGPPLAAGGVALFVGSAIPLAVSRIDVSTALSTTDAKLVLAAGLVGLVAFGLCATLFLGRAMSALGGLVAILAIVSVACTAALIHIDARRELAQWGVLGAAAVVAIMIVIGAVKGRFGAIAAVVAAGVQIPGWIDIASDVDDRTAAAVGGLIAIIGATALALIAVILAATGAADGAYGGGPDHAVVSPVVQPMVQPHSIPAGGLTPRVGPVLLPVGAVVASGDGRSTSPTMPAATGSSSHSTTVDGRFAPTATVAVLASPPQWAPDPSGRHALRYFDGAVWTAHVATDGVVGVDPIG